MSLVYQIQRAVQMPPREIAARLTRKVVRRFDGVHRRGRDMFLETYAPESQIPTGQIGRIIGPIDVSSIRPQAGLIAELAERVLQHRFNLLGSGWVPVQFGEACPGLAGRCYRHEHAVVPDPAGNWLRSRLNRANAGRGAAIWKLIDPGYIPIDWQRDFKSGFRWSESTWYREIRYGDADGADVKVPWELARMQHLPQLAWAYALARSGDGGFHDAEVYQREFCNQVLDFGAANPPRFGVNWCCTMDVAIRAANWLAAYDLLRGFGAAFEPEFDDQFRRTIYEHGVHIASNLEWDPVLRGNHYLADIVGLLFVAAWLPASEETDAWLNFAVRELIQEVRLQFHEDGGNFEASTCYHRLSVEMVAYATAVVLALPSARFRRPGDEKPFPPWYWQRLKQMGDFTKAITRPDGSIPQIGDNDSGRFLKLWPTFRSAAVEDLQEDHLDHRQLMGAIQAVLKRSSMESPWLRSVGGIAPIRLTHQGTALEWKSFPDFGLSVCRSQRFHLTFRCGSIGQRGNGGHAHNDQLSFELWLDGRSLIVDPGTYVYTPLPQERNRFRSTAMHNTLSLAGCEQNSWHAGRLGLFSLQNQACGAVVERTENSLTAEHHGFGAAHRRTLRIGPNGIQGVDTCEAAGEKQVWFHFAPDVIVRATHPAELELRSGSVSATLITSTGAWQVFPSHYSPAYGEITPATAGCLSGRQSRFEWEIRY